MDAMASEQRSKDNRRIKVATRSLADASITATAAFGGLAATASNHHSTSVDEPSVSQDDGEESESFDFGGVPPQQSQAPPVAQAGGS